MERYKDNMSNKLILSTGSDDNYLSRMSRYLDSIEKNSNFDENVLVLLSDKEHSLNYSSIRTSMIHESSVECMNQNRCLQHGEFIKSDAFSHYDDDDVIFFTDGDIVLQRALSEDEIREYKSILFGDVFVGFNASPHDSLKDEFNRIGFTGVFSNKINRDFFDRKVYNTGVLAMTKKTWVALFDEYKKLYSDVDLMFSHYAKQQWLISYIITTNDLFNVIEMPYNVHNHCHYKPPAGTVKDENDVVYYNGDVVLFKHKW